MRNCGDPCDSAAASRGEERNLAVDRRNINLRLIGVVDAWLGDPLTGDESLSAFIAANELGWLNHTIPPEFW